MATSGLGVSRLCGRTRNWTRGVGVGVGVGVTRRGGGDTVQWSVNDTGRGLRGSDVVPTEERRETDGQKGWKDRQTRTDGYGLTADG